MARSPLPPTLRSPRARQVADALVTGFVLLCVVLGFLIAAQIRDLRSLTVTLETTGRGLDNAGQALEGLPSIVGGDDVREVARDAREAGAQAQASAVEARGTLNTISVLAGLAIALIPTGAVLLLYVPLRGAWTRAVRGP
jgi:hypothetical protein